MMVVPVPLAPKIIVGFKSFIVLDWGRNRIPEYREGYQKSGDIEDSASNCVLSVAHEKLTHKGPKIGKVDPHNFGTCNRLI